MRGNWQIVELGDSCEVLDSKRKPITKRNRVSGPYPYYGATGLLDHVEGYLFDEPLVLVGEDGAKWEAGANSAYAVNGKTWVNNHAHVLRPLRNITNDQWLIYYLNFSDLMPFITGLTVPKLNQAKLKSITIPLPPLPEQERIVSILDKAFEGIDKAIAQTEQNLASARELFDSYLNNIFTQKGDDWVEKKLGDVCEKIFAGGDVPKGRNSKELTSEFSIPIYSNGAKNNGLYGFTDVASVTKPSVTVSARGTIGYTAIRDEPFLPVVRLIVLIPYEEKITLPFLYYTIGGMNFGNTGTSIPQLTVPNFKNYSLLLPPVSEQKVYVDKLDMLKQKVRHLEALSTQKLNDLKELKQSLLQQAFAGELTKEDAA